MSKDSSGYILFSSDMSKGDNNHHELDHASNCILSSHQNKHIQHLEK